MRESFNIWNVTVTSDTVRLILWGSLSKQNRQTQGAEAKIWSEICICRRPEPTFIDRSGRRVVWGRCEVPGTHRVGLCPSAGQSGVGRRRKSHGAHDGSTVLLLLLLVVLGELPVKGDGFCCKLGQVFGAAVPVNNVRLFLTTYFNFTHKGTFSASCPITITHTT